MPGNGIAEPASSTTGSGLDIYKAGMVTGKGTGHWKNETFNVLPGAEYVYGHGSKVKTYVIINKEINAMKKNIILLITFVCWLKMANAQNVGIGTKTPTNLFQIGNTPGFSGNHLAIGNGVQGMSFNQYSGTSTWYSSVGFSLMPNGGNGYVGIGTATPAYNLDVHGTGNTQFNLTEGVGGQTALLSRYTNRFELQPSDAFEISVGGIDKRNLCIANNGYVGIATSTPTNYLQIGSYTNANYGGNQIAYGFGTNVTVMNQYSGYSNFLTNTPLNIQSTKDIYLMPGNGDGHVGINTNTPLYSLEIEGNTSLGTANGAAGEVIYGSSKPILDNVSSEPSVALYVGGNVLANIYYLISDKRVKNIIGETNTQNDLETLTKIKITDYTMKDTMTYGNKSFKKVIAQQLEEVYPQVVNKQANFIPNTYLQTDKITKIDSGYVLHFNEAHNISKSAKLLKVYSKKENAKLPILSVLSDYDVIVKAENLSGPLFVYGEQVNDFRTVDYDGLTTLNISATQELSKIIKQQQSTIDEQNEKIKNFDTKLEELINEIKLLKSKK